MLEKSQKTETVDFSDIRELTAEDFVNIVKSPFAGKFSGKRIITIDNADGTTETFELEAPKIRKYDENKKAYSGKISLRVPKELHAELAEQAKENGVSLNQFIMFKLAR
jgi:predicted HicB family RNase H-like nuclease